MLVLAGPGKTPFRGINLLSLTLVDSLGPSSDGQNSEAVRAMCVSPDGRWLAAAVGVSIHLHEFPLSLRISRVLSGHGGDVLSLSFCGDGSLLLSSSADKTAVMWDLRSSPPSSRTLSGMPGFVSAACLTPDGTCVATWCRGGVAMWDLGSAPDPPGPPVHISTPSAPQFILHTLEDLFSAPVREFRELAGHQVPPPSIKKLHEALVIMLGIRVPSVSTPTKEVSALLRSGQLLKQILRPKCTSRSPRPLRQRCASFRWTPGSRRDRCAPFRRWQPSSRAGW